MQSSVLLRHEYSQYINSIDTKSKLCEVASVKIKDVASRGMNVEQYISDNTLDGHEVKDDEIKDYSEKWKWLFNAAFIEKSVDYFKFIRRKNETITVTIEQSAKK